MSGSSNTRWPKRETSPRSPRGRVVGTAIGIVARDGVVTGDAIEPGDVVIGLPSSGVHSNGFTLVRRALLEQGGLSLDDVPPALGRSLAAELLQPTEIYVRAALDLLGSDLSVHGLAHITGDGLLNLTRLNANAGYRIDAPLAPQPVFTLIQELGGIPDQEMWEVFNMGTGFCCVVAAADADDAVALLGARHPGAAAVGEVTAEAGVVHLPSIGLRGDRDGFQPPAR